MDPQVKGMREVLLWWVLAVCFLVGAVVAFESGDGSKAGLLAGLAVMFGAWGAWCFRHNGRMLKAQQRPTKPPPKPSDAARSARPRAGQVVGGMAYCETNVEAPDGSPVGGLTRPPGLPPSPSTALMQEQARLARLQANQLAEEQQRREREVRREMLQWFGLKMHQWCTSRRALLEDPYARAEVGDFTAWLRKEAEESWPGI